MDFIRLIAHVIGRPLDLCQSGFLFVDFVFCLAEIGVNSQIPWAKHIRLLKSYNSDNARTPALGYVGIRMVIDWTMVAHVESNDCRCRCIDKTIARDLRLVVSQLYTPGVTRSWTHHVQPCRYRDKVIFCMHKWSLDSRYCPPQGTLLILIIRITYNCENKYCDFLLVGWLCFI